VACSDMNYENMSAQTQGTRKRSSVPMSSHLWFHPCIPWSPSLSACLQHQGNVRNGYLKW